MARRVATGDGLTTYEVGVPFLLWRPKRRRPPEDGPLYVFAQRSSDLTGVPLLRRLGWLGVVLYLVTTALVAALLLLLVVVEWIVAVPLSALLMLFRVVARRPFRVVGTLVGYSGAHKPSNGVVLVGPPGATVQRPETVVWVRASLSEARRARSEMVEHIAAGGFSDPLAADVA